MAAHQLLSLLGIAQQLAGAQHQGRAGRRGLGPTALGAQQQGRAQARLQLADVQAHRGRRQVQGLGRRREAAQVRDGHQGAQLVQIQASHQLF